jgi:hypothetical protein
MTVPHDLGPTVWIPRACHATCTSMSHIRSRFIRVRLPTSWLAQDRVPRLKTEASYLLYDPRIECSTVVSEKHSHIAIELGWWVPVRSAGAWATLPLPVEDEMLARMVRGECSSTCRFTLAKTRPVFGKNNIGRRLPENRVSRSTSTHGDAPEAGRAIRFC